MMDAVYGGIDVSKDRLNVHALPQGAAFMVARNGEGVAQLVERLKGLSPALIALEATGGFETVVAAALAAASLNPAQVRHFAQALGQRAKTVRSTPGSSPASRKRRNPLRVRCPTK